mmetsp:Transcript_20106/g.28155  ORF Transcript_20106/g.28155 Transcript_20106/m.28155 type:complete len:300 (-) Transcript_20106:140-1039(-)
MEPSISNLVDENLADNMIKNLQALNSMQVHQSTDIKNTNPDELPQFISEIAKANNIPSNHIDMTINVLQQQGVICLEPLKSLTVQDMRDMGLSILMSRLIDVKLRQLGFPPPVTSSSSPPHGSVLPVQLSNSSPSTPTLNVQDSLQDQKSIENSYSDKKRKRKTPSIKAESNVNVEELQQDINEWSATLSPMHNPFTFLVQSPTNVRCTICCSNVELNKPGQLWSLKRHVHGTKPSKLSRHLSNFFAPMYETQIAMSPDKKKRSSDAEDKLQKEFKDAELSSPISSQITPQLQLPLDKY